MRQECGGKATRQETPLRAEWGWEEQLALQPLLETQVTDWVDGSDCAGWAGY